MKLLKLYGPILLTVMTACTTSPAVKSPREPLAIQVCSIDGLAHSARVEVVVKKDGYKSTTYCHDDALCTKWKSKTVDGQPVAMDYLRDLPDAVLVNNLIWPININLINGDEWSGWTAPTEKTDDPFYTHDLASGYKLSSRILTTSELGNYRLRYKRHKTKPEPAIRDEIPACQ
jgi:hypothetical protein